MFWLGICKLVTLAVDKGIDKIITMLKTDPGIADSAPSGGTTMITRADVKPVDNAAPVA